MRRLIELVAAGVGAFFIVLGILTHFVVVAQAVKFPLNEYLISTLVANNVSYFSPTKLNEISGATLKDTSTTKGDVSAGTANIAVWNNFSYVYDETNATPYRYTTERVAFNRRTGELVNCCGEYVGSDTAPHLAGLGYVWPFNTQKKTYEVYDTTLNRAEPATYQGTSKIDGVQVYKFVEQVPATKFATQTIPGSLIGSSAASVTFGQYYQATNTSWVSPTVGAPVKVEHNQQVTLRDSTGTVRLNLINADFQMSPATVAANAQSVSSDDTKASLVITTVPLIAILVGVVLLAVGVALGPGPDIRGEEIDDEAYVDA